MHILVVDDDPGVRELVTDLLTLSGHTVRDEPGGLEALAAARAERFDIVLLDLAMPGMTGIELLDRLREMGVESPVGCITGSRGHPDTETLRLRAIPVLFKPFTMDELTGFLDRLLASRPRPPAS